MRSDYSYHSDDISIVEMVVLIVIILLMLSPVIYLAVMPDKEQAKPKCYYQEVIRGTETQGIVKILDVDCLE